MTVPLQYANSFKNKKNRQEFYTKGNAFGTGEACAVEKPGEVFPVFLWVTGRFDAFGVGKSNENKISYPSTERLKDLVPKSAVS